MKTWALAAIGSLLAAGTFGGAACSSSNSSGSGGSTGSVGTKGNGGSTGTNPAVTVGTSTNAGGAGTGGNSGTCAGDNGMITFGTSTTCGPCADSQCCDALAACDGSMDCLQWIGCNAQAAGTGGSGGGASCDTQFPNGKDAGNALNTCLQSSCTTECGGMMMTQVCTSMITTGDAACDACLTKPANGCCTSWDAVGGEGATGLTNLNDCSSDPTCNGDANAVAATMCEQTHCQADCGAPICGSGFTDKAPAACITCLSMGDDMTGCCGAFTACHADTTCSSCITSASPPASCATNPLVEAVNTCFGTTCKTECASGAGGGGGGN